MKTEAASGARLGWLLAAIIFVSASSTAAKAQCQNEVATRPILFVPGILEDSTHWGDSISGIRYNVMAALAGIPGYADRTQYDLYFDSKTSEVRLAKPAPGQPATDPVADSTNVPCTARNFSISFGDWLAEPGFGRFAVAQISVLTKAYELSQVLRTIATLTYVQDTIVVAHSMGALDARAYIEGLGSAIAPCTSFLCVGAGTVEYTGEVGHLITVDGANAGAELANIFSVFGITCTGMGYLNVCELEPDSALVQALNYHASYVDQAGGDATPRSLPPSLAIDAIISEYGPNPAQCLTNELICGTDLALSNNSQSIVYPLLGQGFSGGADFFNSFSTNDQTLADDSHCDWAGVSNVLHLLPCLADWHNSQYQTADLVLNRITQYTAGNLTSVNIKTQYNGSLYNGLISLILDGPGLEIPIKNPQQTLFGSAVPPSSGNPYTLHYESGGPPGVSSPTIQGMDASAQPCMICSLRNGNWALTFLVSFTSTTPAAPTVVTNPATNITGDGGLLSGSVNPNGVSATAWFEWGPTATLGASSPPTSVGFGTASIGASFVLSGLKSNQVYYYRVDASNGTTTVYGALSSFTTLSTLPSPNLITPSNSSTNMSTSPTFTWTTVDQAASYRLLIATTPAALPMDPTSKTCGVGCVLDVTPTVATYTPPPGTLQAGKTYYWEVHARSALQYGVWSSPIFTFSTNSPSVANVTIDPPTVTNGSQSTVTVMLNGPAPAGGALVTVASSNPSAFPANSNVPIPSGSTTASLSVTAGSVSASTPVTVTATYDGSSASGIVTVAPSGGAVALSSFTITPASIAGGYSTQGNVFLTGPAPPGGATVNLSSSNPHFAQVPPSQTFTVQPGYTNGALLITTSFTSAAVGATITASYNNTISAASMTVLPVVADGVTFNPSTLTAGTPAPFTVYLSGPAPAGTSVTLTSSNPSVLQVPGSVPVQTGATSASVTGVTLNPSSQTTVTLTATYNGASAEGSLTVVPIVLAAFSLSPLELTGGSNVSGTVWLTAVPPSGAQISLSSSSSLVQVPSTINIAQGASSASFVASTSTVGSTTNVIVTASYDGGSLTTTLTLVPPLPYLALVSFSPATVTSGSVATGTVTLTAPASSDGAVVVLTGSFPAVASVPQVVVVLPGATSATFSVATSQISFVTPVTVTGAYNGSTQSTVLTISPPGVGLVPSSLTLSPSSLIGGSSATATVALTAPAPAGGATVSVSSDTGSARVPALVVVPAGQSSATFSVATFSAPTISTATVSAAYNGFSQSSLLTVEPSGPPPTSNPVPFLATPLTPVSQPPNSSGLSFALSGSGFVPGAQAYWNGAALPTTYLSGSALRATLPAAGFLSIGSALITVKNPGPVSPASNTVAEYATYPTVSPLFNAGTVTCSGQPMSANLVDLNGDNKLDLVASGPAENELSVFLGNGDGTFGPELLLTAFSSALVGDFNGDGKPDIATLAGGGGTGAIRLYLGNGDGTFTTAEDTTFSTGYISNVSLVAGDFNGDGRLDIAVTGLGNGASQVYLLMGNGDGTFRPVTSAGSFNQPFGLSVADFDGDGHLDIAVAESGSSAVSILFGNGDGTFQQQAEYPSGGYPNSLAVADFNGDGHPDIAVANSGPIGTAGAVAILLNSGGRVFAPPVSYDVGAGSNSISTDDVNGDGNLDLVFATTQPSRQALLLMGNGDGTFATNPLPLSTTSDWPNTAIGDINGDGAPDVVIPNGNGGLTILLQSVAPVVKIAPMGLQFAAVSGGAAPPPQSVAISNAGAGTVAWTATTSQPWIALGQSAGTAPANLTVSVNPSGLAPGTYSAIVTVAATGASNSPQTVTVELTLSAPPVVPVALSLVPASIVGPGNSAGTVTLSGPAPTGGAAVALSVDTSVVQVPSIVSVAAGLTSASFTLSALAPVSTTTAVVTASYNAVATSASLIVQPGIAAATLFPTKLTFGAIVGSSSQAKTVTLSNSGTTTLSLGGIAASGDYVQGNKCPPSLAPGLSCVIAVAFRPSTGGVVLGALTISDNAGNSPQIVNLSGVGVNSVSTSPSNFAFGTVTVGAASKPQMLTVTNNSAAAVSLGLTASADYLVGGSGTAPCGPNLAARASCTAMITFTPSQNGFIAGTIAISGPSFATQLLTLTGSGAGGAPSPLAFSPSYVNFTSQLVSTTSASQTVTITNVAATTVNILSMAASAGFAAAGGASQPCGGALAAHATCTFAVTFTPSAIGATDGSVAFMTNSRTGPLIYTLLGTGVPPVTLTPASLTFGAQSVGTISPPQTVTLLNNQGAALSLTSLTGSGTYTVTSGGNTPCGRTVAAHSTCTFQVTFSPTSTGTIEGSITIADDAKSSPQVLSLVGTAQ